MRRVVERVYGLLLYAYPADLRRQHGADMRLCAGDAWARRGVRALPRLFIDFFISVAREWALQVKGRSVGTALIRGLGQDVAYAIRILWRSPGFSFAALLTLALGIGANAAIFSLADATLLRPLKVASPSELYTIKFASSYPDFLAYQQRTEMFSGVAGTTGARVNVVADGRGEFVGAAFVSGNYFDVLGVPAQIGRVFRNDDDIATGPGVAILSDRWWRSRFGADPAVIGRTIRINNVPVTIVGVSGRGFYGTSLSEPVKLFLPITQTPRVQTGFFARPQMLTSRQSVWVGVILRLAPGVGSAAAAAAIDAMYRQFHPLPPGRRSDPTTLEPLGRRSLGGAGGDSLPRFVMLLGAVVALTLMIGCANVANLLLSRASARRREIGVRMAIGAGRARVIRQLLVESLVLAALGGGASLAVAAIGLRLLARFQLPGGIDIDGLGLTLSAPVLGFTMAVACGTGLLFGSAPAWRAARTEILPSLRDDSRATNARSALRSSLVAAQVAITLVLLVGTGLFLRSLVASLQTNLGFRTDGVATASINLGAARYDAARANVFYDEAIARLKRLPGVTAAAWTAVMPTNGSRSMSARFEGYQPAPQEDPHVYHTAVTPAYFEAAGTRLLRGRSFAPSDTATAPAVGIINEAAARKYFPGREAVGGRLQVDFSDGDRWIEIVGVAENAKIRDIDETAEPFLYSPLTQDPFGERVAAMHLLVRTPGDAEALLPSIASALRSIDPAAPLFDLSTFDWRVRRLVMPQRMGVTLFAVFSVIGVTLAAIGIYGVASYVTLLRTRELGIRIALGADPARIRRLVLGQGSIPIAAGLAAGLLITGFVSRTATAFLRGVPARDPGTYAAVALLLAAIALAATWIPARRAARLDPVTALRQE